MSQELDFSQREFSRPMLDLLKVIRGQVEASVGNAEALRPLLMCVRLVCRIFYSLNAFGLSEHMEAQLDEWMGEFLALLKVDTNVLDDPDPEKETPLEAVKVRLRRAESRGRKRAEGGDRGGGGGREADAATESLDSLFDAGADELGGAETVGPERRLLSAKTSTCLWSDARRSSRSSWGRLSPSFGSCFSRCELNGAPSCLLGQSCSSFLPFTSSFPCQEQTLLH